MPAALDFIIVINLLKGRWKLLLKHMNVTFVATATCLDAPDCENMDERCRLRWHCIDGRCSCGLTGALDGVLGGIGGIGDIVGGFGRR